MVYYSQPKRYTFCMCVHSTSKCEVTIVISELKQRLSWTFRTYSLQQKFKRVNDTLLWVLPRWQCSKKFIEGELTKVDDDDQVDDYDDVEITFQKWTTSDRAELISCTLPLDEFIEQLHEQLDEITSHSFIARSQSQSLNKLKEKLKYGEVIILGDFAENFSFIVQDEIQGYHWNNQQCSLHLIVLYYCKENECDLVSTSISLISDELKHDFNFVYKVMIQLSISMITLQKLSLKCIIFLIGVMVSTKIVRIF